VPELTQGTETSHYLEEEKAKATPLVAASERGIDQTEEIHLFGVVGPQRGPEILAERSGMGGHRG
jgi:hypothetical protein